MAGGPIYPISVAYPTNGNAYPAIWVGATNSKREAGGKVNASLAADSTVELRYRMPPVIPSGTLTFRALLKANASSGDAKFDIAWVALANGGGNSDTATYVAEGTQTVTWASGDQDDYKEFTLTLDATTAPTAGQVLALEMRFKTASYTLAQVLFFLPPEVLWV